VYRKDAARRLKPLKAPSQDLNASRQEDDADDDDMLQLTPSELVTVPLRARKAEDTRPNLSISTLVCKSPILRGRFATYQDGGWDGGLLAQPVSSDLLIRMLHTPDTDKLLSRFHKSGPDHACDDNDNGDSDSMLNDEEYDEHDSLLDDDDDDDENSILDDDYEDSDSLLFGSGTGAEDDDDLMYSPSLPISTMLQELDPNPLDRIEPMNDDDRDSLLLPEYTETGFLQHAEDSLLQDNSSIAGDSDSPLYDTEDNDMPLSSQESMLTAKTVYSDTKDTRKYYNNAYPAANDSGLDYLPTLSREIGGACNRSSSVYLHSAVAGSGVNEDVLLLDAADDKWPEGWQRWSGMATMPEDENMLGADFDDDDDDDEEMLAF